MRRKTNFRENNSMHALQMCYIGLDNIDEKLV